MSPSRSHAALRTGSLMAPHVAPTRPWRAQRHWRAILRWKGVPPPDGASRPTGGLRCPWSTAGSRSTRARAISAPHPVARTGAYHPLEGTYSGRQRAPSYLGRIHHHLRASGHPRARRVRPSRPTTSRKRPRPADLGASGAGGLSGANPALVTFVEPHHRLEVCFGNGLE